MRSSCGTITIVGRASRMIITGGTNVAPDEVDDVVQSAAGVVESLTVGLEDAVWGQRVVTVVTGTGLRTSAVLQHCRAYLAGQKVPREIVVVSEIPRTPAGKLDHRAVATMLENREREAIGGSTVEEIVLELSAEVFGLEVESLSVGSDLDSTPGWDSLAHMEFVGAIEAQWSIELSNTDVIGIRSIGDMVDCVDRHLAR